MVSGKIFFYLLRQRAHQNYLEHIPHFLALLALSSVYNAQYAAGNHCYGDNNNSKLTPCPL